MKVARILAPFSLSAILFILAYLSLNNEMSGFFTMLLFGAGAALAIVGSIALFSDEK